MKPTFEEIAESLTGYDEIGIEKAFGAEAADLSGTRQIRALAFVLFKRQDQSHDEAYSSAMELSLRAVMELFSTEDEVMPEEPVTDSGKDDSQPVEQPRNSPPSA